MKLLSNLKSIALIAMTGLFIWCSEFKPLDIPDNKVLIDKFKYDSIMGLKPDTVVVTDTVYDTKWYPLPKDTVWVQSEVVNDTIRHYSDSLENNDIKLSFKADLNTVTFNLNPTYKYKLKVPRIIEKIVNIPTPYPVVQPVELKNKIYWNMGIGGNKESFVGSVGATLITKKDHLYGLDISRVNGQTYTQLKIGRKIW